MATPSNLCNNFKGKSAIITNSTNSTVDMTCGICLSDVGQSIRGQIDSCDHYFCFICIMEWSKVETRCPICKQRFSSIRRPTGTNFTHERVVDLPERNQVYSYLGNQSATVSDPYAEIKCGVCSNRKDEELLLLCDLCDSASHTYCVGLGATVPEGDWYCPDCALIRSHHLMFESDSVGCNRDSYDRLRAVRSSQVSTSSFETEFQIRGENYVRTLGICRNLQDRIQQIRENWNSIQSGSLGFPLSFNMEDTNIVRKNCANSMTCEDLGRHNDVKKAWKVLQKVKSREKTRILPYFSKVSNASVDINDVSMDISSHCKAVRKHSASPASEHISFHAGSDNKIRHVHNVQKCDATQKLPFFSEARNISLDLTKHCKASRKHSASPIREHFSFHACIEKKSKHVHNVQLHECDIHEKKLNRMDDMAEKWSINKDLNAGSSQCCNRNSGNTRNEVRGWSVKDEVRSLVKINLKLESKGQKLNSDKFKKIARASTHTILAACGFEPSKSCARIIFMPKCKHFGRCGEQVKYSLMPGSCHECFCSFVKHVVSTIFLEMHGQ